MDVPEALAPGGPVQVFGRWVWATWFTSFVAAVGLAAPRPEQFLAPSLDTLVPGYEAQLVALAAILAMAGDWEGLDVLAAAAAQQFYLFWRLGFYP